MDIIFLYYDFTYYNIVFSTEIICLFDMIKLFYTGDFLLCEKLVKALFYAVSLSFSLAHFRSFQVVFGDILKFFPILSPENFS